jgi:dTDP-4-dehydrorhamnose 3,5-epimerase
MADLLESSRIRGVKFVRLLPHADPRGVLVECFRKEWFPERDWGEIQANRSDSEQGALRGLHYHFRQVDYWYAVTGEIRVGLVDLRTGSPTEGAQEVLEMRPQEPRGLYIPAGVAHGYLALARATLFYLVDRYYDPQDEHGLAWNDPDLAIPWGIDAPLLSPRDRRQPRLKDIPHHRRPHWS